MRHAACLTLILALSAVMALGIPAAALRAQAGVQAGAQAPVERDSAGVRIVENPPRATAPVAFTLGATPSLDVGGGQPSPEDAFDPVQGYLRAAWRADGGLTVIDVDRVHLFDAAGKRLTIAGRRVSGRAPEFAYLVAICRTRGDTVLVHDSHWNRIAALDAAGTVARSFEKPGRLAWPPFDFCFDDGTFVLGETLGDSRGRPTVRYRLARLRTDGSLASELGELTVRNFDMVTQTSLEIVARGQHLYLGDGTTSEVRVLGTDGRLLRIVRTADPPAPITPEDAERRRQSTILLTTSELERERRMDELRREPYPPTWPAYQSFMVDPAGRLWVQDYRVTYSVPDRWTAFDSTGRLLGRLEIPAGPDGESPRVVLAFGVDQVLVRRRTADRTRYLTVYPLVRAMASRP